MKRLLATTSTIVLTLALAAPAMAQDTSPYDAGWIDVFGGDWGKTSSMTDEEFDFFLWLFFEVDPALAADFANPEAD